MSPAPHTSQDRRGYRAAATTMTGMKQPTSTPIRRTALALLAAGLGLTTLAPGTPAAAAGPLSTITWAPCPAYSDEALQAMVRPEMLARFTAALARTECGTVSTPLDHRRPQGRQITVALTRIKAVNQADRLGSLALNPGGPGGSGYLWPAQLMLRDNTAALNQRYDLIGFDPRGVGYSTKTNCEPPQDDPGPPPPGPLTAEAAHRIFESQSGALAACGRSDPEFLSRLTTADVAGDLDRIRAGLGERKRD